MSKHLDSDVAVYPPLEDPNAPGQHKPQKLSGTGTGESEGRVRAGRLHTIFVGDASVRVAFRSTPGLSAVVGPANGIILGAGSKYTFKALEERDSAGNVLYGSTSIYMEAADGAAAYEADIVQTDR